MATPREEASKQGTGSGRDKIAADRGYGAGFSSPGGGMDTRAGVTTPPERGYRPGMTDEQETEKHPPETLSGENALPLTNTPAAFKLSGAGAPSDQNRSQGDAKGAFTPGHKPGEIPAADNPTEGPAPFRVGG